ncbi:MAG: DUF368 domain-containing protein [Lachnospiraceae bacterium]|nr:DUF368 domain-containing protein [Lachnospiraceae bacterium]
MMILIILGGFLMALADSVPGVSGGTVAFLMGIYDNFIGSLNNIVSKDKEKRKKAFLFLVKLLGGWIVGMASAALVITAVFEENIYEISSLFLGFVIFAIPLMFVEEKESFKKKYYNIIFTLFGAAFVVAITYFSDGATNSSLKWGEFDVFTGVLLFVAAMIAISAMVLPGISGSTILLVFGFYQPVMDAIHGFLKLDFTYFVGLCIFGCGVLTGVFTVVKGLKIALDKARSATMYGIIGMMLGSLYAIVMGPTSLKENPRPAMTWDTFNIVFFIIGGVVILGLQALKVLSAKREAAKQSAK